MRITHGKMRVAGVPIDCQILALWVEGNAVQRGVRLDETAMCLRVEHCYDIFDRVMHGIEPG